jgi:mono/diheme cytochrome c family protein
LKVSVFAVFAVVSANVVDAFAAGPDSTVPPVPTSSRAESLSAEEQARAEQMVINNCRACHAERLLAQQRLTEAQWEGVIKKMQGWSAPLEEGGQRLLARYLSRRYAPDAPPPALTLISALDAAQAIARLHDGRFGGGSAREGRVLYQELCQTCHGADGKGDAEKLGVALVEKPVIFRADELAEVVKKGRGRMPAFADLTDKKIGALIAYLRILKD